LVRIFNKIVNVITLSLLSIQKINSYLYVMLDQKFYNNYLSINIYPYINFTVALTELNHLNLNHYSMPVLPVKNLGI
jgi:hypothetical protein